MQRFYRTITVVLMLALAPLARSEDQSGLGVMPTIDLVTAYNAATNSFILRSVLWPSALTGQPVSNCGYNTNPDSDTCFFYFWCSRFGGVAGSSAPVIIRGYRMTDIDLHDQLLALAGQELTVLDPDSCLKGNTSNSYLRLIVEYRNGNGARAAATISHSAKNDNIPANMSCSVIDKSVIIDYGMVPPTEVEGREESSWLQLSCHLGNGYAKIYSPNYNASTGIPLRADGSLFAMLDIEDVSLAHPTSLVVDANTTVSIPITSTLRSNGEVVDGPFSGSVVINIEFY